MNKRKPFATILFIALFVIIFCGCAKKIDGIRISELKRGFQNPPESSRPGVYWYFMDGNISRTGMTADLEAMKKAGIGSVVFLEVNVGVPRGEVDFLSDEWQNLFAHAVHECERLGISMTLGTGPGWTGSGGPWVKPEESMQHLVSSSIEVNGLQNEPVKLPVPEPKNPYFGAGTFTPELKKQWLAFYEDVAVLAFPSVQNPAKIADTDEKALYYRAPYSSVAGTKPFLPALISYPKTGSAAVKTQIIDLTGKLQKDGTLNSELPPGKWTVMRFGRRNNGAVTRPAPDPGLGFESDKLDSSAINEHLDHYVGKLLQKIGKRNAQLPGGLKMLHMDSWEMGSQNWTANFRQEFQKRRGYDPLPYYPVYSCVAVGNAEISERFLWDVRQTAQELVLENHAGAIKKYAHKNGMGLSIEPYDMNPAADLELGNVADVPMAEFWSKGYGFNTVFSVVEAASIAHVNGIPMVQAEAFTAGKAEGFKQYPGSVKEQGDWAFAAGINKFYYHTFQHQALNEKLKPGMTMQQYGVHWDRNQTWWPMAGAYHKYIARCQFMLQQGKSVADILYLTSEGSPQVFRAPASAMEGEPFMPDRKGYNFDGCSPGQLMKAEVKNGRIVFPGGASYRILVLPLIKAMTPGLLQKINALVKAGAVVTGIAPVRSLGLSGYPASDKKIAELAAVMWGSLKTPSAQTERDYGKGKLIWGGEIAFKNDTTLYPDYAVTAGILKRMNVEEDFTSTGPLRYTHRSGADFDIYFVANKSGKMLTTNCTFRSVKGAPQLWNPLTGEMRLLPEFDQNKNSTTLKLRLDGFQSFFIVFSKNKKDVKQSPKNFPENKVVDSLTGSWSLAFNPKFNGPKEAIFNNLQDWITRPEEGIKYYSGIAIYRKNFVLKSAPDKKRLYIDLGDVKNIARVKLNGKDLGVAWCFPFRVEITAAIKPGQNQLEIEVANLWPNKLIGDQRLPDDGIKGKNWPEWLIKNQPRTSGRTTFVTYEHYEAGSPLLPSGLLGPVRIISMEF